MTKAWNSFSILIVLALLVLMAPAAVLLGPLHNVAFAQGNYTLTMAVSGNGTTTPSVGDHSYAPGTNVSINATPGAGWAFTHWTIVGESVYNFVGVTSPSSTHVARDFEVDVDDPTDPPTNDDISTLTDDGSSTGTPQLRTGISGYSSDDEASQAQYDAIEASDDSRWQITDPGLGDNAVFWAEFDIAEAPADITQIDVKLEGYQADNVDKAWLGIWNPGVATPFWKYLEASQQTGDHEYTGTITTDCADYVDGNGHLHIIFFNEDTTESLYVDYVEVVVSYTTTTTSNPTNVIVNGNTTATAYFESVVLTMAKTGNGTTTPATGDHNYPPGTVVDINATADSGWQFVNWTGPCWQYRKAITINHSQVDANLSDFPVLISLTDTNLRDEAQNDGDDILFTSSDGTTQLAHEIEKYDGSTGELVAHVGIPSLSATSDTVIYIYYGNAEAPNQENATGVWDANYMMVQHLEETSGMHYGSTSNGNNGTPQGGVNQSAVGHINGADSFDGTDDYIQVLSSSSLDITGPVTVTAIVNLTNVTADQKVTARQETNDGYKLGAYTNSKMEFEIRHGGTVTLNRDEPGGTNLTIGTTYFVGGWWNGTVLQSIVNGQFERPITLTEGPNSTTANLYIGAEYNIYEAWFWHGIIDELRISNTARSAEWLSTCYNTQMFPSTFYSVGSEVSGVYFSPIGDLNSSSTNVTVDYDMTVTANFEFVGGGTSDIEGTVYEANCSVLDGADVVLSGPLSDNTTTNASGYYTFTVNQTGNYTVNVTKAGITTYAEKWANVTNLGDDVTVDFKGLDAPYRTAPDGLYVIKCSNLWLYGAYYPPGFALNGKRLSDVVYAWVHPS